MIFRKSGKNTWFYNENPIEMVNIFCYLEIVFPYTGSFSETQAVLAQGRKALFWFKSKIKQFLNIDPVKCDLFDQLVLPVLMYGCKVWGFYPAKAIEQVHKDFCKNVLKVKRTTMNDIWRTGSCPTYGSKTL